MSRAHLTIESSGDISSDPSSERVQDEEGGDDGTTASGVEDAEEGESNDGKGGDKKVGT